MAIVARKQRLKRREKPRGQTCLNCHEDIETRFCPHCGQENVPADLTLFAVIREFFAEIFYYDSKLWRTLRTLLASPGRLSTEWSEGRRAHYISPVRLYLSVTFLFFVGAAYRGGGIVRVKNTLSPKEQSQVMQALNTSKLTPLERTLIADSLKKENLTPGQQRLVDAALANSAKKGGAAGTSAVLSDGPKGTTNLPNGWFKSRIERIEWKAKNDEGGLRQLYVEQFPKVLFVILPLFAVVLKLLYWRQRRFFVEHLVFILHVHSFAFLALLPIELIRGWFVSSVAAPLLVGIGLPLYVFVAMLRFYKQPWWLTLLKSWVLGFTYLMLIAGGALLALVFAANQLPDPPASARSGAANQNPSTAAPVSKPQTPSNPPALQSSTPAPR